MTSATAAARAEPPHSVEAEQAVLGSLLLDNSALPLATEHLTEGDFFNHEHRALFGTMVQMIEAGHLADVITVFERMQAAGKVDAVDLLSHLNALAQSVPSACNIGHYAAVVNRHAMARRGMALGQEMQEALSRQNDPCTVLAHFAERLTAASTQARRPAFKEVDLGELEKVAPRPQGWFWGGYLPAGHVTLLGGHGGAGKSTIALMLAGCLATGREFLDKPAGPANVLFYSAEDPEDLVLLRLARVCRQMNLDMHQVRQRLRVIDATGLDPVLFTERRVDGSRVGHTTAAYEALKTYIEANQIDVLIADNASDVFDGDEINRSMVRGFMRSLAQLVRPRNGAVLLLAHVDKNTSRAARTASSESYSGSTAWHNSVRSRLFLLEIETGMLELQHQKCNLGPKQATLTLRWPQDGLPMVEGGDTGKHGPTAALRDTLDRRAVLALIAEFYARGEFVAASQYSPANAVRLLAGEKTYPKRKPHEVFALLRDAERAGQLVSESYRTVDRKDRQRLALTDAGRLFIGAPAAPTAPTYEDGAGSKAGAAQCANRANLRVGGMGGLARAHSGGAAGAEEVF